MVTSGNIIKILTMDVSFDGGAMASNSADEGGALALAVGAMDATTLGECGGTHLGVYLGVYLGAQPSDVLGVARFGLLSHLHEQLMDLEACTPHVLRQCRTSGPPRPGFAGAAWA